MKNKAGSVINNLPGLVKRQFIDLKNIREDNIEPLIESQDGILNNLKGKIKPYDPLLCSVLNRRLVSSVGRASVCCAGGRGFEPQTGRTLRVLK